MICVKELVKNFDDVCAVNNITLNIPEGEMLGLLGTNGAGKTTLLRMIAGVLEADGGSIVVDGAQRLRPFPWSTSQPCLPFG